MKKAISMLLVLVMAVSLFAIPVAAANGTCTKCGWATTTEERTRSSTIHVSSCENDDYSHPHFITSRWSVEDCFACGYEVWTFISETEECICD